MVDIVRGFSIETAARLTGLSVARLKSWDRTGFYVPGLADENRRVPFSRVYTFRDLVSLQVLRTLRQEHRVSLQHLRQVKETLAALGNDAWTHTTLSVLNRKVVFEDEAGNRREIVSGQHVIRLPLSVVHRDMAKEVDQLRRRDPADIGATARQRNVVHNALAVAGTRIPVRTVAAYVDEGYSDEGIIAEFPSLTVDDVQAVRKGIAHAA